MLNCKYCRGLIMQGAVFSDTVLIVLLENERLSDVNIPWAMYGGAFHHKLTVWIQIMSVPDP